MPAQYGGLSKEGEQEFTNAEPATEEIIKPASKHTIEFPVTEVCSIFVPTISYRIVLLLDLFKSVTVPFKTLNY